jgi:MbtH protein
MEREERDDQMTYEIVVNQEDQYALWLADEPTPLGWNSAGKRGSKSECLAFVREVWTDMTPLSLRRP